MTKFDRFHGKCPNTPVQRNTPEMAENDPKYHIQICEFQCGKKHIVKYFAYCQIHHILHSVL